MSNILKVKSRSVMQKASLILLAGLLLSFKGYTSQSLEPNLNIYAKNGILLDAQSGQVLWEKEADTPRFHASTVKILTALLCLEHLPLDHVVTVPKSATEVGESSMYLEHNEKIKVENLLYGLMLRSGNDAGHTIALEISGSEEKFAELMNQRAKALGCNSTSFKNPHGLNHGGSLCSARDLAIIAQEAMKNPAFRKIVATQKKIIPRNNKIGEMLCRNTNKLIGQTFPKGFIVDGVKTGWTVPAGPCIVASASQHGHRLIAVLFNSKDRGTDCKNIFTWGFHHEWNKVAAAGKSLYQAKVVGGTLKKVLLAPSQDVYLIHPKKMPTPYIIKKQPALKVPPAPIQKKQPLGMLYVSDNIGNQLKVPLLALSNIEKMPEKPTPLPHTPYTAVLGVILGCSALIVKKRP